MNKPGVYIHIPFCSGKCYYCDFYSSPSTPDIMNAYTDAVCRHISEVSGVDADTVYFGGGTPSLIGSENLIKILDSVRKSFALSENSQITLEANPGDICISAGVHGSEDEALKMLRDAGFDRISFGVQTAQDGMLKAIGRRHDFKTAQNAVYAARKAGFQDITLDLMYGLPKQSMDEWKDSINAILVLDPTHISCYALKLEETVPLYSSINRLPDDDTQLDMYLTLVETLEGHGYEQYEISNFAKPGFRSRHNMKYWIGADYYGFGPSAHSFVDSVRYAYTDDTEAYIRGDRTYKEYTVIEDNDSLEEYIMLSLRTSDGISTEYIVKKFGLDTKALSELLQKYEYYGLAVRKGKNWSLTPRGFFVSNQIIVNILDLFYV